MPRTAPPAPKTVAIQANGSTPPHHDYVKGRQSIYHNFPTSDFLARLSPSHESVQRFMWRLCSPGLSVHSWGGPLRKYRLKGFLRCLADPGSYERTRIDTTRGQREDDTYRCNWISTECIPRGTRSRVSMTLIDVLLEATRTVTSESNTGCTGNVEETKIKIADAWKRNENRHFTISPYRTRLVGRFTQKYEFLQP